MAVFLSIQFLAFIPLGMTSKAGNILLFSLVQISKKVLQNAIDGLYSRYTNDHNTRKYGFAGFQYCSYHSARQLSIVDFS
jgi:hypothetical protein